MTSITAQHRLEPGTELAQYRITSKLGEGGMGEIYLAEDLRLGRRAAIKVLGRRHNAPDSVKRFIREAKAASALNHPHILTIYDIGEIDGSNFIATEWIDGRTLRDELNSGGALSAERSLTIAAQVADALSAAHRAGIIHRDIKPENIMIRADGYVKVLDFGLAKLVQEEDQSEYAFQTTPGIIMGTVAYMSPEQARGRNVDPRTDIFSLGIVTYEMLTGRQPFTGETDSHTIVEILERKPPSFSGASVPADIEQLVMRALEKDAGSRYASADEFAGELRAALKKLEFEAHLQQTSGSKGDEGATKILLAPEVTSEDSTIAVLPFVNMSRDEEGDYFSDGLAEELLNVLSKIRGLRVAARTSAFSFKGRSVTIGEIGKTLGVSSILEGSIRKAGDRVRIAVQLVNVADGYHLWSETYDRTMNDIFAVQDDIASSVVEELRTRLLGKGSPADTAQVQSEVQKAVRGRAAEPEAQRLMLLGRHFLDRLTKEDTEKAVAYFHEALDLDDGYALCWAELARAYSIQAGRAWVPVDEGFRLSSEAVRRSLELEPALAEGHAQLGRILSTHEWDLTESKQEYDRALELAPGSSQALDGASILAYKLGDLEKASALSQRVLVLDPLSAAYWHNYGLMRHAAADLASAEDAFRRSLDLVPQRFVSRALLALVLADQGRLDEAISEASLEPYDTWRIWALAIAYHLAGDTTRSDEHLKALVDDHSDGNAFQIAEVYAMREELDKAFHWLDIALAERDTGLTHARVDPRFRSLHLDPRWTQLLSKIGF